MYMYTSVLLCIYMRREIAFRTVCKFSAHIVHAHTLEGGNVRGETQLEPAGTKLEPSWNQLEPSWNPAGTSWNP